MQEDFVFVNTPIGIVKISGTINGVSQIKISEEYVKTSKKIPESLMLCVEELMAYFNDKSTVFTFPIHFNGTEFQNKVWQELQKIPFGKTISYSELAQNLSVKKASRAVANANAKNPILFAIPCHRVIGSNGNLTGYSGGLWRKKWLLEHESGIKQETLF